MWYNREPWVFNEAGLARQENVSPSTEHPTIAIHLPDRSYGLADRVRKRNHASAYSIAPFRDDPDQVFRQTDVPTNRHTCASSSS
jgi:hypothetical protein